MKPPSVDLRVGDCREVAQSLLPQSVHCCLTSPPYFGLRSYSTTPVVWGGDPCSHQWAEIRTKRSNGSGGTGKKSVKQVSSPGAFVTDPAERATISEECALCGAVRCELGLEPSVDLYLVHLVEVFAAIRPALRDDGVLAVNISDSFSRNSAKGQHKPGDSGKQNYIYDTGGGRASCTGDLDLPEGNLLLIPARFALAMQAAGWILRAQIVIRKANPMPESLQGWRWEPCRLRISPSARAEHLAHAVSQIGVNKPQSLRDGRDFPDPLENSEPCPGCKKCEKTDGLVLRRGSWRPTRSHEFLFLFAKTENYFASGEAVREPSVSDHPSGNGFQRACQMSRGGRGQEEQWQPGSARNARDVLDWIPDPTPHAHYAAFPPFLPAWIIKSCSPEQCCSNCGAPYAPVIRRGEVDAAHQRACGANGDGAYHGNGKGAGAGAQSPGGVKANILRGLRKREIGEHRPTCNCQAEPARATIFDPFGGSGTTGIVARDLGRDCILAELNPEYAEIARQRLASERYNPETQRNKRDRPRVGQLDLFATSVPNYSEIPNSSKDEISSQVILDSSNTCRSARRQFPPAGAPFGDGDQAVYCQSCGKRGVWYRKERQNPEGWHRSPTGIGEVCAACDPDAAAEPARTIEQPALEAPKKPRKRRAIDVTTATITHGEDPETGEAGAVSTIENAGPLLEAPPPPDETETAPPDGLYRGKGELPDGFTRREQVRRDGSAYCRVVAPVTETALLAKLPWLVPCQETGADPQDGDRISFFGADGARLTATVVRRISDLLEAQSGKISWCWTSQWPRGLMVEKTP